MENTGDNSESSSDENAMVIDENYVEKDVKERNKTEPVADTSCTEVHADVGDGNEVESVKETENNGDNENIEMEEDVDNDDNEDSEEDEESGSEEEGTDEEGSDGGEEIHVVEGTEQDDSEVEEGTDEEGSDDGEEIQVEEEDWETDNEGAEVQAGAAFIDSDSGDEDLESCPICLNKFRGQDVGSPESCDHHFCLDCIMEWANNVNTCPVDRQVFHLVLAKHSDCESVYKRFPIEDKSLQESEEDNELTYCEVCHQCNREDRLLLCDGCDKGYHCECLTPPLDSVPIEEWFCPECALTHAPGGGDSQSVDGTGEGTSGTDEIPMPPAHTSPMRRQIPRTQASERVRTRIQATRAAIAQMFESEDDFNKFSSSSVSPRKRVTRKRTVKRKKRKKTKTPGQKTKTTKRKTKTTKRKKTKRGKGKGKKRKVTKRKKKASSRSSTYSPRSSAAAPLVTPKSRLAKSLGLSKPPQGRTIPLQKLTIEKSMEGQRAALGITSLSIMGSRDELIGFQDGDENMPPRDPQPSSSTGLFIKKKSAVSTKYSQSALKSRRPIQRPPLFARNEASSPTAVATPITSSGGPLDILGSIIQEQDKLLLKGEDITINRDGSLTAKKTLKSDKLDSEKEPSTETKSNAEEEIVPAGTGAEEEILPAGTSAEDLDEAGKSPYTDSDDDIREPILTAETDGSKEFDMKSPNKDRLPSPPTDRMPSPPRNWNKSPPVHWQRQPSPPPKVRRVSVEQKVTKTVNSVVGSLSPRASLETSPTNPSPQNPSPQNPSPQNSSPQNHSPQNHSPQNHSPQNPSPQNISPQNPSPQNPSLQNPSPQQSSLASPPPSPHTSSHQPSPVIDEIEPFPLCKDGYNAEDSRSPKPYDSGFSASLPSGLLYDPISESPANLDKGSNSSKEQRDKRKRSADSANPEALVQIEPVKDYTRRLSVDSEDSVKKESQPKVPFSELPRIPKKKRHSDPIEVITIDDDDEEKTEDSRAVLQRLEVPERKGYREKRDSRGRRDDSRGDRHDRRSSNRRRDVSEEDGDYGRSGQHDKRRVVLNERGGLIVRTEDSSHGEGAYKKRSRDRSRSKSRERGQDRSRGRVRDSWDKSRSKEESHRSRSTDQNRRKRRHERKERSRSGSRSDQERHDKSHRRKKKRRDRSSEGRRFLDAEEQFDHQPTRHVRAETKVTAKDKTDPRDKAREKSSKERNDLKEAKSDLGKDKHDTSKENSDLREKIDLRSKADLRERLDNRLRGDLREKLDTKFRDKIDMKLKPETKDTRHVEEWRDHDTSRNTSEMLPGSKRCFKVSDAFESKRVRDKTVGSSPDAGGDTWSSPRDFVVKERCLETDRNFKVNSSFTTGSSLITREKSPSGHENSIADSKKKTETKLDSTSVPSDSSTQSKPLLPTPLSFPNVKESKPVHEIQLPVEAMYDPSMPTDTASPPVFLSNKRIEQPISLQQPHEFVLTNRLQSPGGTGLLGDGSFLIPSEPGMINVLQPHQNLGPIPMSLGMLPPGFPPGLHPVPTRPHMVMNPLLLNRPPPFTRLPQIPGGMPRFNWPTVDPQGVLQVPNRFDGNPLKDQNVVELQNRFASPFPTGPSPMHTRPTLVNGNFEAIQSNPMIGHRPFTAVFPGRDDPRQTLMQPSIQKTTDMGEKMLSDQARTTQTNKPSTNPLTEISKLLNLQAQLVGLTKGGNTNTTNSSAGKGRKGVMFKVPLVPVVQGSGSSRSTEKTSSSGPGRDETEVVDMDMSPLEDDDNIVLSPEYEKELKAEKDDKVSRVIFMNKAEDVPCSAVELTNVQKAGKFMKKLHLQERVVEEVKLAIKPFYAKKKISKEEYKDILRKSVPKICHSKSGDINPAKIQSLIEAYVAKCERAKEKGTESNGERARSKSSR